MQATVKALREKDLVRGTRPDYKIQGPITFSPALHGFVGSYQKMVSEVRGKIACLYGIQRLPFFSISLFIVFIHSICKNTFVVQCSLTFPFKCSWGIAMFQGSLYYQPKLYALFFFGKWDPQNYQQHLHQL